MATLKQEVIKRLVSPEIRILVDKMENDESWKQAVIGGSNGSLEGDYIKARHIAGVYDAVTSTKVFNKIDKWYFNRAIKRAKVAATKAAILRAVLGADEQPEPIAKAAKGTTKVQMMSSLRQSLEQEFEKEYGNYK